MIMAGAGAAVITNLEEMKFSTDEVEMVARPAARILGRHKEMQAVVRSVADPFALVSACAIVFGSRVLLWLAMRQGKISSGNATGKERLVQPLNHNAEPANMNGQKTTPDVTSIVRNVTPSGGPAADETVNRLRMTE